MIEAVGIVVPAHNEEALLPACLRALRRAAEQDRFARDVTVSRPVPDRPVGYPS